LYVFFLVAQPYLFLMRNVKRKFDVFFFFFWYISRRVVGVSE